MANNQKIADEKKVNYQEAYIRAVLTVQHEAVTATRKDPEKSHTQSHESYMKDPEKSCADCAVQSRKSYMKVQKRVVLTLQHKATKFTRKTWRRVAKMKLAWLYPTKVRKQLQS